MQWKPQQASTRFASSAVVLSALSGLLMGCNSGVARFPLKDPIWRDTDLNPVHAKCHKDEYAKKGKPAKMVCAPKAYVSSFAWDAADHTAFRPISRFFAVDPATEAANVNSLDEVPNSSWFENRIGQRAYTPQDLVVGPCGTENVLDPSDTSAKWVIDKGKANGANPGFRVRVKGIKFMLKADLATQPERATAATAIAARLYHAAGFHVACDSVVYVNPAQFELRPGLKVTDNTGTTRILNHKLLNKILKNASRRGKKVRFVASRWLPGRVIGPFTYSGKRKDDPNDIIYHEDRRDLRGGKLLAAWMNHFDSREQNSMATWLPANKGSKNRSKGIVKHWYIDLGDCFGSEWQWEGVSKRLGHANYMDFSYLFEDFVTFGVQTRPWDTAKRSKQGNIFGFFTSDNFEADNWKGGYPNPAFGRMTERDGAWFARILAYFTAAHVEAAIKVGDFTDKKHEQFLIKHMLIRRKLILERYFKKISSISKFKTKSSGEVCAMDLARMTRTYADSAFKYRAKQRLGTGLEREVSLGISPKAGGEICFRPNSASAPAGSAPDAPSRYTVVKIHNGVSDEPIEAHFYDQGPGKGLKLVGLVR